MGGTLRLAAGNVVISEYATFGWKESGWWGSRGACTLLGPEGSDTGSGLTWFGDRFLGLLPDFWALCLWFGGVPTVC